MTELSKMLIDTARAASKRAYAPYSNFHVGAALQTSDGNVHQGCNVENASYGLTTCAERNAIAQSIINGDHKIQSIVIYTEQEQLTPPCGACRQVLAEFMPSNGTVSSTNHLGDIVTWRIDELLPHAFLKSSLLSE